MIYLGILNDWLKWKCLKSDYKRDTKVRIYCNVNKVVVLYLFTNIWNYHFFEKLTLGKQSTNEFNVFIIKIKKTTKFDGKL